jgi:hypothetical protein
VYCMRQQGMLQLLTHPVRCLSPVAHKTLTCTSNYVWPDTTQP